MKANSKQSVSPDDKWCDMVREECAKAIVAWMRGTINVKRPINTLTLAEMKCMAEAVIARYIVLESQRATDQEPYAPVDDIAFLL